MTWKRFLFVALPLALAGLAALAEGGAWALNGVAPRRHDLDRLVAAIEVARLDAPLVLLGDSVTQDIAKSYRLTEPGRVANLTTNLASGAVGGALLLRRYLDRNAPPRAVVIVATPDYLSFSPAGKTADVYLTSVFRRPEERTQLTALGLEGAAAAPLPVALQLEARLAEPVLALLAPRVTGYSDGDLDPMAAAAPETPPVLPGVAKDIAARLVETSPTPAARWAFAEICRLAGRHGFAVHVLRAPTPDSLRLARPADFAAFAATAAAATAACPQVRVADINAAHDFPDHAFRDGHHLRRPGWSAVYARLLADELTQVLAGTDPLSQQGGGGHAVQ